MSDFRLLRRRSTARGLSLLEIMMSMVLMVVVITSFAVVYPSGVRLHRMSRMSSGAAQATRSIISELKSLPLKNDLGGLSLGYIATNGFAATKSEFEDFPKTKLPEGYTLPDEDGVVVTLYDLDGGSANDSSVYASIKIKLIYKNRSDEPIETIVIAGKGWSR